MSSSEIQRLKEEQQELQKEIISVVEQLEARKKDGEVKLQPDQIIRPAAEKEAIEKLAKLELVEQQKKAAAAASKEPAKTTEAVKPEQGRQKKGAAAQAAAAALPLHVGRLDLRIGKIVEVSKHPESEKLYIEKIDLGEEKPRTILSGLAQHVPIEEMQDRIVLVLCNLKPAKLAGIFSEGMVMCASNEEKVEVVRPPSGAKAGDRVYVESFECEPDAQLNPKKKIWEQISPDLKTNDQGVATYKGVPLKIRGVDGHILSTLPGVPVR